MADDVFWSEVLDEDIPYHDQIICMECFLATRIGRFKNGFFIKDC